MTEKSEVVLLNEEGMPAGVWDKATVHGPRTPLHLAFSCHVLDRLGRVLITRRSLVKVAWPGVWTNSFCGHPRPGEANVDAVRRHGEFELGLSLRDVKVELPDFRYRATDASGIVENEICPVYLATAETGDLHPRPDEVMDFAWVDPADLAEAVRRTPMVFSPWLVLQAQQLEIFSGAVTAGEKARTR